MSSTRQKLYWLFFVVSAGVCSLASLPASQDSHKELIRIEQSRQIMGTVFTIAAYGEDPDYLEQVFQQAFDEASRIDAMLSNYRPESELSFVNRHAAQEPVRVSKEFFELLQQCLNYSELSEGAFDITVGPLMKLWGFFDRQPQVPTPGQIEQTLKRVGYRKIQLNPEDRTVRFSVPGMELDPGGIGKGYAVDRMVEILKSYGVTVAFISAGGSSIFGMGSPPGYPQGWPVKIKHPLQPDTTVEQLWLKDTSLSTSGTYEKFFKMNGVIYSHLIDPRTGWPVTGLMSASVLAPRAIDSEAWTKPVLINGPEWSRRHVPKQFRVLFCTGENEQPCKWLY